MTGEDVCFRIHVRFVSAVCSSACLSLSFLPLVHVSSSLPLCLTAFTNSLNQFPCISRPFLRCSEFTGAEREREREREREEKREGERERVEKSLQAEECGRWVGRK